MMIEAKISNKEKNGFRLSVRIETPEGGISINDLFVREIEGKLRINFPLSRDQRPNVYLRGKLKQEVNAAIAKAYYQGTEQGAAQDLCM